MLKAFIARTAATMLLVGGLSACSSAPKTVQEDVPPLAEPISSFELAPSSRGPVLTLDEVLFDFEEATLRAEADAIVTRTVRYLRENPERRAIIEGHTDHVGDAGYNAWLSNLRAESVRDALVDAGVAPSRIETNGLGETRPVASNDTPAGRQSNRRVEIVFVEQGRRL